MDEETLIFEILRKEDLLALRVQLYNMALDGAPAQLVRRDAGEPAFLVVHFPSQNVAEEAFPQNEAGTLPPGQVPVRSWVSGPSRLVFRIPDGVDTLPLTLETLLDWTKYEPVLAPGALPPDATQGPGLAQPGGKQTALELPVGLMLSPDASGGWLHEIAPIAHDGRYELWRTQLGERGVDEQGQTFVRPSATRTARVLWTTDPEIPFTTSLKRPDRRDIPRLSSDFSLPQPPAWVVGSPIRQFIWRMRLGAKGLPNKYIPRPVNVKRLMLSALGAWSDIESAWDYPTIIPGNNDGLGYPQLALEQWTHRTAQGRDQYVRTVEKAFLADVANRASIITITEREFHPTFIRTDQTPQGPVGIFGSVAYLRQRVYVMPQERDKDYAGLGSAYAHGSREQPFRRMQITTDVTPALDPADFTKAFWPRVGGRDFLFKFVAEDWDGRTVTFERPLLVIPLRAVANASDWTQILQQYNAASTLAQRTVELRSQPVALAPSQPDDPGKTQVKTSSVVFQAQQVGNVNALPPAHPPYLPEIVSAQVNIAAVEQLLGKPTNTEIEFDLTYLDHGLDAPQNKAEVFAKLKNGLALPFAADKAGGLIKPDSSIGGLSRSMGPVGKPDSLKQGSFDTSVFDQANLLGGLKLSDILKKNVGFDPAEIAAANLLPEELEQRLNDPNFLLKVPLILRRELFPPGVNPADPAARPTAMEVRYVWKPELAPVNIPFFQLLTQVPGWPDAQLVLRASLLIPTDGSGQKFDIRGDLTNFALVFAGAMQLKLARLTFLSRSGQKMDISAEGLDIDFIGPLAFVSTLKNLIPSDGFSDPPYINVDATGIMAGFTLAIPSFGVGIFSIQNIALSAKLSLPFVGKPAAVRFAISERHKPFIVTVTLFGGGGFFAISLNAGGIEQIEAAIEFGGNISLNLGIASGGVYVMAGIYFSMTGSEVKLTGYLRCGGYLEVLGIISISIEFYLGFTYRHKDNGGDEVWGQASVTVCVKVLFFSMSVKLSIERRFAGAAGDPTFAQTIEPTDWDAYCAAFA
ncbi:MAG: hypothetical protein J5I90_01270 [Caldilineales bacterium]|nr:hypothetical protein [Caldilineales bacterium]